MLQKYKTQEFQQEVENRGQSCSQIKYIPPCSQYINAFGRTRFVHRHIPPDWLIPKTSPTFDIVEPNTVGTWPYAEVANFGDPSEGDWLVFQEREENIGSFFDEFDKAVNGQQPIVFFYLNYDNPLNAEERKFLLVGCTNLLGVGEPIRWKGMSEADVRNPKVGNQVWTRWLHHSGSDSSGLFPLHELWKLQRAGKISQESVSELLPQVPSALGDDFRYVCKKFTSGRALIYLEILANALSKGKASKALPNWNWDGALDWVNAATARLWKDRGRFPGLGSVLTWLGHTQGTLFYREQLQPLEAQAIDPIERVREYLDSHKTAPPEHRSKFKVASEKWNAIRDEGLKEFLLEKAAHIEISPEQLTLSLSENEDQRAPYGLISSPEMIRDNPYVLCEELVEEDVAIAFEVIDQGLCPSESSGHIRCVEPEDSSRLRALAVGFLRTQAEKGHTWVTESDLIEALNKVSRSTTPIQIDHHRLEACRPYWAPKIGYAKHTGNYFLHELRADENKIESIVQERIDKPRLVRAPKTPVDWQNKLKKPNSGLPPTIEKRILAAQADACKKVYGARISIINGSAGTGKTSTLKAVLDQIVHKDRESVALLAYTGRAAQVIQQRTNHAASTIHSFLKKNDWLWKPTWALKRIGGKREVVRNVIIDEASMLDIGLLAGLFRAIDWSRVHRLVFVGDVFQLPPIGPGKPFVDIIRALTAKAGWSKDSQYIGSLDISIRQITEGSQAIRLARSFRDATVGEVNEVMMDVFDLEREEKDLAIRPFAEPSQIPALLTDELRRLLRSGVTTKLDASLFEQFDSWLDIRGETHLDRFQIIAPFRKLDGAGVEDINVAFQTVLRGGMLNRIPTGYKPNRVGSLTLHDKVLILRNTDLYSGWNHSSKEKLTLAVTNGQLGVVRELLPKPTVQDSQEARKGIKRRAETSIRIGFKEYPGCSAIVTKSRSSEICELGYAMTVHKSQGSEFDYVFFVLPLASRRTVPRELIYTALTRAKKQVVLFLQSDYESLKNAAGIENSAIAARRSGLLLPKRPDPKFKFDLQHMTDSGIPVASKSEALICNALWAKRSKLTFEYNRKLESKTGNLPRWPDFTIFLKNQEVYWEHAGMLSAADYDSTFKKKQEWYKRENLLNCLLVSHELEGIDTRLINKIIELLIAEDVKDAQRILDPDIHRGKR
jgi:exodeoxyribonuclease V alpha subunit